jgi:hypothetical protein
MATTKKKIKIADPKRDGIRKHLKMFHPFLSQKFRPLKKTEVKSAKVFAELFGDEAKFEPYKLKAIYEYQL